MDKVPAVFLFWGEGCSLCDLGLVFQGTIRQGVDSKGFIGLHTDSIPVAGCLLPQIDFCEENSYGQRLSLKGKLEQKRAPKRSKRDGGASRRDLPGDNVHRL